MYDHGDKKRPHGAVSAIKEAERRTASRHVFTASADVTEIDSGARFSTRLTDLGPGGCFVDTTIPFPVGVKVRVNIHKGETEFEIQGSVVYSQTGLGMGIAFDELRADQRHALDAWLADLTDGRQPAHQTCRTAKMPTPDFNPHHAAFVRLVRLMIGKGILTEAEGSSVLHDPVL
jgi:hypothetical protein